MHSWYHVKRCWKVYLSDWMSLYYAISLSAWETTNMKKKVENYILKDFPKGRMQMRCKCLSETFPSNLNNYKLYKLLKSQGSKSQFLLQLATTLLRHCPRGNFRKHNNPHPSPSLPFKVGRFVVSTGSLKSGTTLLGRGGGGKALFSPP